MGDRSSDLGGGVGAPAGVAQPLREEVRRQPCQWDLGMRVGGEGSDGGSAPKADHTARPSALVCPLRADAGASLCGGQMVRPESPRPFSLGAP